MVDASSNAANTSGGGGPMVLNKKRLSSQSPKTTGANLIDDGAFNSIDHAYAKQLDLLAEMGFHDREFNLKTLKAANGNMQDALEIIVAANQKLRNRPSSISKAPPSSNSYNKNILDDLDFITPTPTSDMTAWPEGPTTTLHQLQSQPIESQFASVSLDEPWGETIDVTKVDIPQEESLEVNPDQYQSDDTPIEQTIEETVEESTDTNDYSNDPLAFNPFKSTSTTPYSDDLFANPW